MKSSITMAEIKSIYANYGLSITVSELTETLNQCNEQADEVYLHYSTGNPIPTKSASEWAHHFAKEDARVHELDNIFTKKFQSDAYGY